MAEASWLGLYMALRALEGKTYDVRPDLLTEDGVGGDHCGLRFWIGGEDSGDGGN
jgi:hypothetical protein